MALINDNGVIRLYDEQVVYIEQVEYSPNGVSQWESTFNPLPHKVNINGIVVEVEGHKYRRVKHAGDIEWQIPALFVGTDGENALLQVEGDNLQTKLESDTTWTNIYDLTKLKGEKGNQGEMGKGWEIDTIGTMTLRPSCCSTSTPVSSCNSCGGNRITTSNTHSTFLSLGNHRLTQSDVGTNYTLDGITWFTATIDDVGKIVLAWDLNKGTILEFTKINGGLGYTIAPDVVINGGDNNAVATAVLSNTGGRIKELDYTSGTGHSVGNYLLEDISSGSKIRVIVVGGIITSATIEVGGSSNVQVTYDISALGGVGGSIIGIPGFSISSINLVNGGSNYISGDVSFTNNNLLSEPHVPAQFSYRVSGGKTVNEQGVIIPYSYSDSLYDSTGKVYVCSEGLWTEVMNVSNPDYRVKVEENDVPEYLEAKVDNLTIEAYDSDDDDIKDEIRVKENSLDLTQIKETIFDLGLTTAENKVDVVAGNGITVDTAVNVNPNTTAGIDVVESKVIAKVDVTSIKYDDFGNLSVNPEYIESFAQDITAEYDILSTPGEGIIVTNGADTVFKNDVTIELVLEEIDHNELKNLTVGNPHTQYLLKGSPEKGDMLVANQAGEWDILPKGDNDQVLTVDDSDLTYGIKWKDNTTEGLVPSNVIPEDVILTEGVTGISTQYAKADHKHQIVLDTEVTAQSENGVTSEGIYNALQPYAKLDTNYGKSVLSNSNGFVLQSPNGTWWALKVSDNGDWWSVPIDYTPNNE